MDLVKLIDIDLESSTVSESAYNEYDDTHAYIIDDIIYVSFESNGTTDRTPHEIYKSLADANTGNYPPDNPSKWSLIGATNKWKMFDGFVNTQTEDTSTIIVEIDASKTNSVGLFQLTGKTVTLTLSITSSYQDESDDYYRDESDAFYGDTAITKKTEIIDLDSSPVYDYYEYFFAEFFYKSDIFWTYPYYYKDAILKIEIEPYLNETKCGMCALGKSIALGTTQWNPHISIEDYSKKDTDSLGRTYLSQGNFAKKNEFDLWVKNVDIDMMRRILTDVRGLPIITNANEINTNYESLIIYGFYRNFEIIIPGPVMSKCSLEIEGLI